MVLGKAGDLRRAWAVAAATVLIWVVHTLGINHNLVFLLLLLSIYVSAAAAIARVRTLVATFACFAAIALTPYKIAVPAFIDPAHVDDRRLFTATIPEGQIWRYTFTLSGLANHEARCGQLPATVYMNGERLNASSVRVRIDGTTLMEPPSFLKGYYRDEIELRPKLDGVRQFSVALSALPGATPAIRLGPEIHGTTVYSDAVYVQFKNANCTILYETFRTTSRPADE